MIPWFKKENKVNNENPSPFKRDMQFSDFFRNKKASEIVHYIASLHSITSANLSKKS